MIRQQLYPISFQHLQVFFSLAKTLNFTLTAQELNMTQSGVSRSLSKLEEIVGKPLFKRTTKMVALTPMGEACYHGWQDVLDVLNVGYGKACAQHRAYEEEITVGVALILDCDILHSNYFKPFKESHENIKVTIVDCGFRNELQQGIVDVMIMPEVEKYGFKHDKYSWQYVYKHPLYVLLPSTSPLFHHSAVHMKDILSIPNLVRHPESNPNPVAFLQDLYRPFGIAPSIGGYYRSNYEIEPMLAQGNYMCIVGDFFPSPPIANIKKIPIAGVGTGIVAVWNRQEVTPSVSKLLNFICPGKLLI